MDIPSIKAFLDEHAERLEHTSFIEKDPVSIPHLFSAREDIEIAALFAATLAWGNRTSIINSCIKLLSLMDHAPFDFIKNHHDNDLKRMMGFVHRTFNTTDLLYFIHWLRWFYSHNNTLEKAFFSRQGVSAKEAIIYFNNLFFSLEDAPSRTRKHVSNPAKKSAAKRLNMMLRWMVRENSPVDFGIWKGASASSLMIPLDTHTGTVARHLGLLERRQNDWQSVEELTAVLVSFCPEDPVKYDYALFGLGAERQTFF